jgi:hypothetical protein
MGRAAGKEAAGGQAALAGDCATDPVTLARVAAALLRQLGGTMPVPTAPALGPSIYLDRRTVTLLTRIRKES